MDKKCTTSSSNFGMRNMPAGWLISSGYLLNFKGLKLRSGMRWLPEAVVGSPSHCSAALIYRLQKMDKLLSWGVKGTVPRDFLLQVIFIYQFPPSP